MQLDIKHLYELSRKKKRSIIGLMSGTSMDGLDIALCTISGAGKKTKVQVDAFSSIPYEKTFRDSVLQVFAKRTIDFQELVLLNVEIAEMHASLVLDFLKKNKRTPSSIDAIASHGQTVFHAPRSFHGFSNRPNATLQIGDGDHLAIRTSILTLSDFRQKHVAKGGEGAPLALYGDVFLFSKKGYNRFLVNLGGIANFTYLPADENFEKAFATDTGPANGLMDRWAQQEFQQNFDKDALIAKAGMVQPALLEYMLNQPFFKKKVPKTTGPELFGADFLQKTLQQMPKGRANPFDIMATLCQLTAESVTRSIQDVVLAKSRFKPQLILSGGGAQNPLLVEKIAALLPNFAVKKIEDLGIKAEAKEAVIFALLANETLCGKTDSELSIGGLPYFGMGKISFPN